MLPGGIEGPDELHLGSAVDRRQLAMHQPALVSRVGPGETLLHIDLQVAVVAVGLPVFQALPIAGGVSRRWRLWGHKNMQKRP